MKNIVYAVIENNQMKTKSTYDFIFKTNSLEVFEEYIQKKLR